MKLHGIVAIHVKGEVLLRRPGVWDKLKSAFGGTPDLRTGKQKAALEATAVVSATRDALRTLGVTNAVSLLVDDLVLFQDKHGRADDLDDLVAAFQEHEVAIGGEFGLLRLTVEHEEAGLHLVLEVQAQPVHGLTEPAARIVVSGRVRDLEPRPGEDAESYRRRAEPLAKDAGRLELHRRQFEAFVTRLKHAVAVAMPEATTTIVEAQAMIQRPTRSGKPAKEPRPTSPAYDPYRTYYPSPLEGVMQMMMWTSILSWGMRPDVIVVNHSGEAVGNVSDPDFDAGAGADSDGFFDGADEGGGGDFGDGGGDVGDVGGGDFGDAGGGDFGGDFGGFDF